MKQWKKVFLGGALFLSSLALVACGGSKADETTKDSGENTSDKLQEVVVGVCPGPYGDMTEKVIAPLMEKKGYKLSTKLFNDYVQPDKALASKSIDANLMQHTAYLEKFSADNKLELSAVQIVPTLGMGIYSKKYKKIDDIPDGATVSIANDPSNLARTLQLLEANDLVKLKDGIDETKATVNDIAENPKNLELKTLDAAQLPRSLDNVDVALIPGNFSWAADLDPADALALEKLKENYKNVVAVRTADIDSDLGKAFKEVLDSQEFKDAIEKSEFKDFDKPEFWSK